MIKIKPKKVIKDFLNNYPNLNILENKDSIIVFSEKENNFDVGFEETKRNYIISFGQWNEYLPINNDGANTTINLFKFGLSNSCRFKLLSKGEIVYKSILEFKDHQKNEWVTGAKLLPTFYPFWIRDQKKIKYLENKVIEGSDIGYTYAKIRNERKFAKLSNYYSMIWIFLYLQLTNYDFKKIYISILLYSPVIFLTLFVPIFIMEDWFKDKKYGKRKKIPLNKKEKCFLFSWISIWSFGFLAVFIKFGFIGFFGISIFFLPFIIVGFSLPLYLYFQNR
jgi:hypothetical protein